MEIYKLLWKASKMRRSHLSPQPRPAQFIMPGHEVNKAQVFINMQKIQTRPDLRKTQHSAMKRGWDWGTQDWKGSSDVHRLQDTSQFLWPLWALVSSMVSAHLPDLSLLSYLFPHKTILCPSQSLLLTVAPTGDTFFQICTWLGPLCHCGFGLNVTIAEDFPDHPIPCSFPLCTPSLPSALSRPLTCFILVIASTTIRNYLFTCVPQLEHKLREGVSSWSSA